MDLLKNSFYLLTASPRDNRRKIMELAEQQGLLMDPEECLDARTILTNPRKRLSAEIAWLPGIGPKRTREIISLLESTPENLLSLKGLIPVSQANLLAAGMVRLPNLTVTTSSNWILKLAQSFEAITPKKLEQIINEERITSGFPEIADSSAVEHEIQERREYYRHVTKSLLDRLTAQELVQTVTNLVDSATKCGEIHGPILIDDLVDAYEIEAQAFLEREEENIHILIEKLKSALIENAQYPILDQIVDQIIHVTKNWDTVAQPIQVSAKSRGLDHDASHRVAQLIRDITIDLFNDYGKLALSQKLTQMLQEVFAEVGEVAERTAQDAHDLDEIAEQRVQLLERAKNEAEKWRKEITYEAEIGTIFKEKFKMSPEGILWHDQLWELESITRVRWGGVRHSVNGIPTGTTYTIFFGHKYKQIEIELKNKSIYTNITNRLWQAVGSNILVDQLTELRNGKYIRYGTAILKDTGIELERRKLFGSNERIFCPWNSIEIWNGAGAFCIAQKGDSKTATSFSYLELDNIHALEIAIRAFFKQGGTRLSSLLQG